MYCQVPIGKLACLCGVVAGGGLAGVFLGNVLLSLLAILIAIGGFSLFRLWKGSRELARK